MKKILRKIYSFFVLFGFDIHKTVSSFKGLPFFFFDLICLKKQKYSSYSEFPFGRFIPCLADRFSESGTTKGHYFNQDLLVARRVCENNPDKHVDVGSRVDGFVAHVASFRSIEVFDVRHLSDIITNIKFIQADMMKPIEKSKEDYCDSLSCLHALEHFGLGRYGDPICYDGYLKGLENFGKILKCGGKFYLSVPIGPQRIEFNAHRVFSISFLIDIFYEKYIIDHFSYIDDNGIFYENVKITDDALSNNFYCKFGLGIFEMTKI